MNLLDTLIADNGTQTDLTSLLKSSSAVSVLESLDLVSAPDLNVVSLFTAITEAFAPVGPLSGLSPEATQLLADISNQNYHADSSTVTRSKLELILRSPAHLKASLAQPRSESAAMLVGTALHAAVLEPTLFATEFVAYCGGKTRASAEYKAFVENHSGKIILSEKDFDKVIGMRDAIRDVSDFPLWELLQLAEKEKTLEWEDKETGLRCKIRPDALTAAGIFDLKKTQDARAHKFMWSARDYGYDLQAAMYRIGVREALGLDVPFLFIAVEEEAPHGVQIYDAPAEMIAEGERRFRQAMTLYAECLANDHWPGYTGTLGTLTWRSR